MFSLNGMVARRYCDRDAGKITRLMRRGDVWEFAIDDGCSREDLGLYVDTVCNNPAIYAIGRDPKLECFIFAPINHVSFHIHVITSTEVMTMTERMEGAMAACGWMFDNTQCRSIVAMIPDCNEHVKFFVSHCGMKRVGRFKQSFMRDGVLYDETIYQGTKEQYKEVVKQWHS